MLPPTENGTTATGVLTGRPEPNVGSESPAPLVNEGSEGAPPNTGKDSPVPVLFDVMAAVVALPDDDDGGAAPNEDGPKDEAPNVLLKREDVAPSAGAVVDAVVVVVAAVADAAFASPKPKEGAPFLAAKVVEAVVAAGVKEDVAVVEGCKGDSSDLTTSLVEPEVLPNLGANARTGAAEVVAAVEVEGVKVPKEGTWQK